VDIHRFPLEHFEFRGFAQHNRGWQSDIYIRVGPPMSDRPDEFVCAIECPFIFTDVHRVRAGDPQHAYALAFRLLRFMLSDFSLFDGDGSHFSLPRLPPEEEDWIHSDPEPEQGIRIHADAIGPDGVLRPFAVGVSPPTADGDGYSAEVRYEKREPPAAIVRGKTPTEVYYAGIQWIETKIEADRLTLIGLWNEPIRLPKRPRR
jgi:hypothetical protein